MSSSGVPNRVTEDILVGIDVGSSRTKLLAVTPSGTVKGLVTRPTRVLVLDDGGTEFSVDSIRTSVLEGLRELIDVLPAAAHIVSVSVCSIGEAFLGLDAYGMPTTSCPTWFDSRSTNTRSEHGVSVSDWYNLTGLIDDSIYTVHRIQAMRNREPDAVARVRRWLCVADYVVYLLSGTHFTSPSLAARTGLLDRSSATWSGALLDMASVTTAMLPRIVWPTEAIGVVCSDAAAFTGLFPGTPIVNAGHDHACAAFACGLLEPGSLVDSAGTAEAVKTVVIEPLGFGELVGGSFDCYPYVAPGRYLVSGHLPHAGALLTWVRNNFGQEKCGGAMGWESAMMESEAVAPGAEGIRIVPFFGGSGTPWNRRTAAGRIFGLRPTTKQALLMRAALEATACWLRINARALEGLTDAPLSPIIATGGGARNTLWLRIKAAILEVSLTVPQMSETAALGAALLGGWAAGIFESSYQAVALPAIQSSVIEPSPALSHAYKAIFEDYEMLFHDALTKAG